MLKEACLYEAVMDAINNYAALSGGKYGFTKTDLRKAIDKLGGDELDFRIAMITGINLIAGGDSIWKS